MSGSPGAVKVTYRLHEPQQARKAFTAAWEHAKAMTMAGHRLTLTVAPERRSDVDNSHYHFLVGEISKQANTLDLSVFDVNNDPSFVLVLRQRLRDREDAKRLLISGFRNQTENDDQVVRAKCGRVECVAPGHMQAQRRKALARENARLKMSQHSRVAMTLSARARSNITADVAREILHSNDTERALAERFGISRVTVGRIRRGERWGPVVGVWAGLV